MSDDMREARLVNPTVVPQPVTGSLELTVYDLRLITSAVERAQAAKLRFEGALVAGRHKVHVRWKAGADQRDGDELVVTKITRA